VRDWEGNGKEKKERIGRKGVRGHQAQVCGIRVCGSFKERKRAQGVKRTLGRGGVRPPKKNEEREIEGSGKKATSVLNQLGDQNVQILEG